MFHKLHWKKYFKNVTKHFPLFSAKPSTPEGPLKVSDVTKTGCKLKWKKPEDDGGIPISEYEVSTNT